jgi:hypothetical protein
VIPLPLTKLVVKGSGGDLLVAGLESVVYGEGVAEDDHGHEERSTGFPFKVDRFEVEVLAQGFVSDFGAAHCVFWAFD